MYKIILPSHLNKEMIRQMVIQFRNYVDTCEEGETIQIDMTQIAFIEPAGMVSLNNIIHWAKKHKKIQVDFIVDTQAFGANRQVMDYLSDCGFFAIFGKSSIYKVPSQRSTYLPLKNFRDESGKSVAANGSHEMVTKANR